MFYSEKTFKSAVAKETQELNDQITTLTAERDAAIQKRDTLQTANQNLTQERDAAIQKRDTLQASLDSEEPNEDATQALNETFESLDELDESVQNAETPEEKTTAVVSLVNTLRQSAGSKPARLKSKTESPNANKEKDENVSNDKKSFLENLEAVKAELL